MAATHENPDGRLVDRMMYFTDAVFAIVLTLLVLELRPPEHGHSLAIAPLFAFALSFGIASIFWVAHLATTRQLVQFDWPTAIANLAFLFPICLLPFVSAWVGEAPSGTQAWAAYSGVMIAVSLGNMLLSLVQSRGGGRLLAGGLTPRERTYRLARAASPGLAFVVGLGGAVAGEVHVPQLCSALIPVFLLLARLLWGPQKPAVAQPAA